MEKKQIRAAILILVIALASFSAGRWLRFRPIENGQLGHEIALAQEQVELIAEELGISAASLSSSKDVGAALLEGIHQLRETSAVSDVYRAEVLRTLEDAAALEESLATTTNNFSSRVDTELDKAIAEAQAYEDTIRRLKEIENLHE